MLNGDVLCKFVQADRPAENPFVRVAVATKKKRPLNPELVRNKIDNSMELRDSCDKKGKLGRTENGIVIVDYINSHLPFSYVSTIYQLHRVVYLVYYYNSILCSA